MIILLTGGSASGKSGWAEGLAAALHRRSGGALIYLATMAAEDGESRRRVARHRAQRAGRGFLTVERPAGLRELTLPPGATVLLEDLGNLAANELYRPGGGGAGAVLDGLEHLCRQAASLVVVGNEVFADGEDWDRGMADYLRLLATAHTACAARADAAGTVACGIPLWYKRPEGPEFDALREEADPG